MGCCVIAVMIVGQVLEAFRRLKLFLGFRADLYPDDDEVVATGPTLMQRLQQLMRRPAARVVVALLLVTEATLAGDWLYTEHRDHLQEALAYVTQRVGGNAPAAVCTAKGAVATAAR